MTGKTNNQRKENTQTTTKTFSENLSLMVFIRVPAWSGISGRSGRGKGPGPVEISSSSLFEAKVWQPWTLSPWLDRASLKRVKKKAGWKWA